MFIGASHPHTHTPRSMSPSEVQGPLRVQLHLSSHITSMSDDHLLPPGRTRSLPIGESSQGPSYGRRTQSESALSDMPLTLPALRPPPVADNAAPDPPSPVPTEIIPPELTQEEIVVDIQRSGIKVRDFAYEDSIPHDQRAPELFDPILAWHVYEAILDNTNPARNSLNGRHLRRLLDLGWVSEEEDGHRWLQKDRDALENFDSRPYYPWKALNLTKPNKDDLREVATSRFQWVNADQLVPQFINRGISRLAAVFRGPGVRATPSRYQKRPAQAATDAEEQRESSPRPKKRRLSTSAESTSSPGPAGSSARSRPHVPLALVNGKPPQQFPAGRPSESPPRPATLPSQGTLSRSLQRHLSMSSVSSPCSTDLSRTDSRTTLTHGTNRE